MKITKILAKNYKAFPLIELSLRDFNLIIGKNGSGKSSLLRLLPFIIDSILIDDDRIISFEPYKIDLAANFQDLVFGQSTVKPLSLGLAFIHDGIEHSFVTKIIYSSDFSKIIPISFSYSYQDQEYVFSNLMNGDDLFRINDKEIKLTFKGLLPHVEKISDIEIKNLLSNLDVLKKEIECNYLSYIGPFRKKMNRVYENRINFSSHVGVEGELTPYILFNQDSKFNFSFINSVNQWMKKNLENTNIELIKDSNSFCIHIKKNNISSNIVDHGVGFSQLLPLIVSKFSRSFSENFGMEIVEQPELHLHPAMCGSIIDLYLTELNISDTIILETHSKEIILRLRRRVAEDPSKTLLNKVQLIFVDQNNDGSEISYINILEDGTCNWWPDGIFEESYDDIIAIEEASHGN